MERKVGDIVQVKNLDWYNENKNEEGKIKFDQVSFIKEMEHFCGSVFKITEIRSSCYVVKGTNFVFTEEMIEPYSFELKEINPEDMRGYENSNVLTGRFIPIKYASILTFPLYLAVKKEEPSFEVLQKVLVRNYVSEEWSLSLFVRERSEGTGKFECLNGICWDCCIPYEGNEHLLGKL